MADRRLALENQIPFYANWASKFIRFSNARNTTSSDLNIQLFLDDLKKNPKYQDWQIAQAQNAVKLYVDHFMSKNKSVLMPGKGGRTSNYKSANIHLYYPQLHRDVTERIMDETLWRLAKWSIRRPNCLSS